MRLGAAGFIATLILSILLAPLCAGAQPPAKVPKVGILSGEAPPVQFRLSRAYEAFLQGLRELGHVEGQTVALELRWAEGQIDRLPTLAAELVELRVDVILAVLTPAVQAAKRATTTIPVVMVAAGDPVGTGLVRSIRRPEGNVTGLSAMATELTEKRLQFLKEAVPKLRYVGVLWHADDTAMSLRVKRLEYVAAGVGLIVKPVGVRGPTTLENAFSTMMGRPSPQALLVTYDPLTLMHRRQIVEFPAQHGLPAVYELRDFVEEGGLMSYGTDRPGMFRRAATYVDKILKGAKPADLPVEQPMKFELVINLKTAQALGLTIPPTLLFQADEVIR